MSYLVLFCSCVFFSPFSMRLSRLGKRELISVRFARLFNMRLLGLFPLSGKDCSL